jgi:hypothetical protein
LFPSATVPIRADAPSWASSPPYSSPSESQCAVSGSPLSRGGIQAPNPRTPLACSLVWWRTFSLLRGITRRRPRQPPWRREDRRCNPTNTPQPLWPLRFPSVCNYPPPPPSHRWGGCAPFGHEPPPHVQLLLPCHSLLPIPDPPSFLVVFPHRAMSQNGFKHPPFVTCCSPSGPLHLPLRSSYPPPRASIVAAACPFPTTATVVLKSAAVFPPPRPPTSAPLYHGPFKSFHFSQQLTPSRTQHPSSLFPPPAIL